MVACQGSWFPFKKLPKGYAQRPRHAQIHMSHFGFLVVLSARLLKPQDSKELDGCKCGMPMDIVYNIAPHRGIWHASESPC